MLWGKAIGAGGSGGIEYPLVEFIGATYQSGTTAFSSVDIGTPHPNRLVIVAVSGFGSSQSLPSATINGVAATIHVTANASIIGGVFSAIVTSGSTGTIELGFASSVTSCTIGVWVADAGQLDSTSPADIVTRPGSFNTSLTGANGGFAIATNTGSSNNDIWSGDVTEVFDNEVAYRASMAHDLTADTSVSMILSQSQGRLYAAAWA